MSGTSGVEAEIEQWRGFVQRQPAITAADADEMEAHLRDRIADLEAGGLTDDEAFLIAVRRMGAVDAISREFAREHSERLWKQLTLPPAAATAPGPDGLAAALGLGVGAALALRAGIAWVTPETRLALDATLLVLPFLAALFAWRRRLRPALLLPLAAAVALVALLVNAYPFETDGSTVVLAVIHLPVLLWLAVGVAYVGGDWSSHRRRMDFVRFTGEWVVYYTLIALGGGLLVGILASSFAILDIEVDALVGQWIVPCGAAGAVLVAAWLVEAKQAVIENIAPVLTKVFTPLTVLLLVCLFGGLVAKGGPVDVDRDLLIVMDVVLVLVLGLLLYAISARDPQAPAGFFDRMQLVLLVAAIAVDLLMLVAMLARIAEFGLSPNKTAALGLNVLLLVDLCWSARLQWGFVTGARPLAALERWQTAYLPLYGAWAALVVLVLPLVFGFA